MQLDGLKDAPGSSTRPSPTAGVSACMLRCVGGQGGMDHIDKWRPGGGAGGGGGGDCIAKARRVAGGDYSRWRVAPPPPHTHTHMHPCCAACRACRYGQPRRTQACNIAARCARLKTYGTPSKCVSWANELLTLPARHTARHTARAQGTCQGRGK